jgi:Protein of unknown function (DUF3024)
MALTEIELKRCEKALAAFIERRRPPPAIRSKLDMGYRISGHSVELFEIRPHWQDGTKMMETPVAKATLVRTKNLWKVFWMRQDLKWHGYEPCAQVQTLDAFLEVVDRDAHCCFFG